MTWFKVDDSFYRSRKVRKLGRDRVPAVGVWTLCGDWSADNLTDGFVPWEVVEDWDEDREWAKRLIVVGLWSEAEVDGETGIQFHDWEDWQPTSEQVKQRRRNDAERRARWREQQRLRELEKANQQGTSASQCDTACDSQSDATVHPIRPSDVPTSDLGLFETPDQESRRDTTDASRAASALPDPTRPDPTRPSFKAESDKPAAKPRKRPRHHLPDTWRPNDNHTRQAQTLGLDLDAQVRRFRNHAEMNDRLMANWDAAFRQWLEHATEYAPKQGLRRAAGHAADPSNGVFWEQ